MHHAYESGTDIPLPRQKSKRERTGVESVDVKRSEWRTLYVAVLVPAKGMLVVWLNFLIEDASISISTLKLVYPVSGKVRLVSQRGGTERDGIGLDWTGLGLARLALNGSLYLGVGVVLMRPPPDSSSRVSLCSWVLELDDETTCAYLLRRPACACACELCLVVDLFIIIPASFCHTCVFFNLESARASD
ncbi:hypothetical protein AKJ16_DCAP19583 [Drosera capensis]